MVDYIKRFTYSRILFVCFSILTSCDSGLKTVQVTNFFDENGNRVKDHQVTLKYKTEDLNDKASYDKPRFQFRWEKPGDKYETVWSIKIDGTDLRQVIDAAWAEKDSYPIDESMPIVRSPNNRYVVTSQKTDQSTKVLYDLKTREKIFFAKGGYYPHFEWTQDSNHVWFYLDGKLMDYDVSSKALTEKKKFGKTGAFHFYDNDEKIAAVTNEGIGLFTNESEEITRVKLDLKQTGYFYPIAKRGKLIVIHYTKNGLHNYYITSFEHPQIPVADFAENSNDFTIDMDGNYFYYSSYGITRYEIKSGKREIAFRSPIYPRQLTIYNEGEK